MLAQRFLGMRQVQPSKRVCHLLQARPYAVMFPEGRRVLHGARKFALLTLLRELVQRAHQPRRIARYDRALGPPPRDDGPGANDGVGADVRPHQHDGMRPNEHVVADDGLAGLTEVTAPACNTTERL